MTAFSSAEQWGRLPIRVLELPLRVRRDHCACGLDVVADADNPTTEYARHVRGARHQGWWSRVRLDWQGEDS